MKTFVSIVSFIISLILFFFVAPQKTFGGDAVMNIPTMFESSAFFILGCMFATMSYMDKLLKPKNKIGDSENKEDNNWVFISIFIFVLIICIICCVFLAASNMK